MVYCLLFTYGKYYGQPFTTKAIITLFTLPLLLRILHKWLLEKINDDYLTIYTFVLWLAKWFFSDFGHAAFLYFHTYMAGTGPHFGQRLLYFLVTGLSHIMTKTASNEKKIIDQENKLQSKNDSTILMISSTIGNFHSTIINPNLFIKYSGLAALVIFFAGALSALCLCISPIVILMVYLHLVYGTNCHFGEIQCLCLLRTLSGSKNQVEKTLAINCYLFHPSRSCVFCVSAVFFMSEKSKISHLNQVPEADESSIISLDDFLKEKACQLPVKYYVSSWGGGLGPPISIF